MITAEALGRCECGNRIDIAGDRCEWCDEHDAASLIVDTHDWLHGRFGTHCRACGLVWYRRMQGVVDVAMSGPCPAGE